MSYQSEVLADSPAGYWRYDETSGFPQDISGNANNVTASFGVSVTYSEPGAITSNPDSKSIKGTPLDFRAPDHATLDLGDVFTLEMWMRRTRSGVQEFVLCKGVGAYVAYFGPGDDWGIGAFATQNSAHSTIGITADGRFHHCVGTKNGSAVAVYVDGIDVTFVDVPATACVNTTTVIALGADGPDGAGTNRFEGWMDEIAVYPTALSAARVQAHYNAASVVAGLGDNPPIGILGRGAGW